MNTSRVRLIGVIAFEIAVWVVLLWFVGNAFGGG